MKGIYEIVQALNRNLITEAEAKKIASQYFGLVRNTISSGLVYVAEENQGVRPPPVDPELATCVVFKAAREMVALPGALTHLERRAALEEALRQYDEACAAWASRGPVGAPVESNARPDGPVE